MQKLGLLGLVLTLSLLGAPRDARACLHAGAGQSLSQTSQQIVVVHDAGREDLIVGIDYRAGEPLAALGMVVPVPALPDAYETLDPALFTSLRSFVNLHYVSSERGLRSRGPATAAVEAPPSLEVLAPVRAGPFEIQPLRARGAEAASALNDWLTEHQLTNIPEVALRYYVERNWTFLVVRVVPADGQAALAQSATLPPLQISFASERAVVPLRLEAQGSMAVSVYLITRDALEPQAFAGATARGFHLAAAEGVRGIPHGSSVLTADHHRISARGMPPSLRGLMTRFGEGIAHLRVLHCEVFGAGRSNPSTWDEEFSVPGLPPGQRLMGGEGGAAAVPAAPTGTTAVAEAEPTAPAEDDTTAPAAAQSAEAEEAASSESPSSESSSSCACAAHDGQSPSGWHVALALGLMLVWRRRRGRAAGGAA